MNEVYLLARDRFKHWVAAIPKVKLALRLLSMANQVILFLTFNKEPGPLPLPCLTRSPYSTPLAMGAPVRDKFE